MSGDYNSNSRYNPFIDSYVLNPIMGEQHTVGLISELGIYGIRLIEAPYKETPSSVSITSDTTGGPVYSGVTFSTTPGANEFRVDYGDRGKETGLIQFHSSNNGELVNVNYRGKGAIISQQQLENVFTASMQQIVDDEVSLAGGNHNVRVFSSSGTYIIPAGVTKLFVTCIGGGGEGGPVDDSPQGGNGGTTSFGAYLSVSGGAGGNPSTGTTGGLGAQGMIGSDLLGGGGDASNGVNTVGGIGGAFLYDFGAGGAGGDGFGGNAGGGGGAHGDIKSKYISGLTPGASVTVTVGAGGTGGGDGVDGTSGAVIIQVVET